MSTGLWISGAQRRLLVHPVAHNVGVGTLVGVAVGVAGAPLVARFVVGLWRRGLMRLARDQVQLRRATTDPREAGLLKLCANADRFLDVVREALGNVALARFPL